MSEPTVPPAAPAAGGLFADPAWAAALELAYGWRVEWVTAAGGGRLPLVVLDDAAGRRVSMLPFADCLPITAPHAAALLPELRARFPAHRIVLKCTATPEELSTLAGASVSRRAVGHRATATSPGPDSTFRRNVRRAERSGLTLHHARDSRATETFYRLYSDQRIAKFGAIPQPRAFFRAVAGQFVTPGRGYFLEVRREDRTIASALVLSHDGGEYYKFGTSDPEFLRERPNNLLFDHLRHRVSTGATRFLDLGLSGAGESYAGLRRFKASIGTEEYPITYLTADPPDFAAAARAEFLAGLQARTGALVSAGADPDACDELAGRIYHYFA